MSDVIANYLKAYFIKTIQFERNLCRVGSTPNSDSSRPGQSIEAFFHLTVTQFTRLNNRCLAIGSSEF